MPVTTHEPQPATTYPAPARRRQAVPSPTASDEVAAALGCIVAGRPLPQHLRPVPVRPARPTSVQAGIERILRGGR